MIFSKEATDLLGMFECAGEGALTEQQIGMAEMSMYHRFDRAFIERVLSEYVLNDVQKVGARILGLFVV